MAVFLAETVNYRINNFLHLDHEVQKTLAFLIPEEVGDVEICVTTEPWSLFTHLLHTFDFGIDTKIKIANSKNSGQTLSELVQIHELHELWKQNKLV